MPRNHPVIRYIWFIINLDKISHDIFGWIERFTTRKFASRIKASGEIQTWSCVMGLICTHSYLSIHSSLVYISRSNYNILIINNHPLSMHTTIFVHCLICMRTWEVFLLERWDLKNYWSLRLPPSIGQVARCLVGILLASVSSLTLGLGWIPNGGTCRRHFDVQVNKTGDQHSGRCTVINDVSFSLESVLFILF